VVGRVLAVRAHVNGDHILVADVIYKEGHPSVQIIFGGITHVVRVGALIPMAPASKACQVEGKKMRRRVYRGIYSYGELCSLYELGLMPTDTNQVAIFKSGLGLTVGTPIETVLANVQTVEDLWLISKDQYNRMYGHQGSLPEVAY
jgi:hypothetical protein